MAMCSRLLWLASCWESSRHAWLSRRNESRSSCRGSHAWARISWTVIVALLGLCLVGLLVVEGLLTINGLEGRGVNCPLWYLRKRCAGRVLGRIRGLPRMCLWVVTIGNLNGHLLVEGLLKGLLRPLRQRRRFDIRHGNVLLWARLMHW